jgi:replicative DNA helicase
MPQPVAIDPSTLHAALPFNSYRDAALVMVRKAFKARQSGGLAGLPTSLTDLDDCLGGLQTGLHILAAEPGAGKTALALQIARAVALTGAPAVYASFDESPVRLALKALAGTAEKNFSELANGNTDEETVRHLWERHTDELAALSFVPADAKLTPTDLAEQMRGQMTYLEQHRGLLVIDYLQPWASAMAAAARIEIRAAVGEMALALRKIALELEIPVLVISAQNRSGQGSTSMTSLRESSDLEYGADSIMLLADSGEAHGSGIYGRKLFVAKNRFGRSGYEIPLAFDGRTQTLTVSRGYR